MLSIIPVQREIAISQIEYIILYKSDSSETRVSFKFRQSVEGVNFVDKIKQEDFICWL
jgi:hypothetical protein